MLKGYTGTIVRIDLTTQDIRYEEISESVARKYIGGIGIAAKILWDETTHDTEPFSPENPLIFIANLHKADERL